MAGTETHIWPASLNCIFHGQCRSCYKLVRVQFFFHHVGCNFHSLLYPMTKKIKSRYGLVIGCLLKIIKDFFIKWKNWMMGNSVTDRPSSIRAVKTSWAKKYRINVLQSHSLKDRQDLKLEIKPILHWYISRLLILFFPFSLQRDEPTALTRSRYQEHTLSYQWVTVGKSYNLPELQVNS